MKTIKILLLVLLAGMLFIILSNLGIWKITYKAEAEELKYSNVKVYAFEKVLEKWGEKEWASFSDLIKKESKWNPEAKNPQSSAYGLAQFLTSTWETVDCKKTSDPEKQIDCAITYVEQRYDTPTKALQFHTRNNWY